MMFRLWILQVSNAINDIHHKHTWAKHLTDLKNTFVTKLNLLKKCSFLRGKSLLDFYFNVILPSVSYGIPGSESPSGREIAISWTI